MNPPSRLGVVGALIAFLGLVSLTASLFYGDNLVSSGVPCNTAPFSAPICIGLIAVFWVGLLMVPVGGGVAIYARVFRKTSRPFLPQQSSHQFVSRRLEVRDESIIQATSDLCYKFNITRFKPQELRWVWNHPRGGRYVTEMPADQAAFVKDTVCLSSRMQGELELDEWRTLIASALVFYFSPTIRRKYGFTPLVAFSWLPASFVFFFLYSQYQPPPASTLALIIVVLAVVLIFVGLFGGWYYFAVSDRRLWLASDRIAAESVGREALLRTFRQIDSMNLSEEISLQKRRNFLIAPIGQSYRPSVEERIKNLDSHTG